MTVSVMITTKNRSADLRQTCRVLQQLNPPPLEVLITADGCTDGTVEFVREALSRESPSPCPLPEGEVDRQLFPEDANLPAPGTTLTRLSPGGRGERRAISGAIVCQRAGPRLGGLAGPHMREARGELVLALDDDSYPEQPDCVARIAEIFRARPRLAILHFPQRTDEYPQTLTQSDFGPERPTRSFANSGAVLRRDVYLQLPGFEPRFFHMYEEPDYALQCVAAGYEVLFSPAVTIRHHYSAQARSELRNHHRHARNEFWSTLMRCPFPFVLAMLAYRVYSQFCYACKRREPGGP